MRNWLQSCHRDVHNLIRLESDCLHWKSVCQTFTSVLGPLLLITLSSSDLLHHVGCFVWWGPFRDADRLIRVGTGQHCCRLCALFLWLSPISRIKLCFADINHYRDYHSDSLRKFLFSALFQRNDADMLSSTRMSGMPSSCLYCPEDHLTIPVPDTMSLGF